MDPNFPPQLDIRPSVQQVHCGLDSQLFGDAAQRDAIRERGIAGRVWEAAYALISYLDPHPFWEFDPPPFTLPTQGVRSPLTIVELGSGSGAVASKLVFTLQDAQNDVLILTDLPDVCQLLRRNVTRAATADIGTGYGPVVSVRPLVWGNYDDAVSVAAELHSRRLTHILCSDLVYFPELLAPLLRTLIHLTSPPLAEMDMTTPEPMVIVSYKIRSLSKEMPFWSAFGLWFSYAPVLARHIGIQTPGSNGGDGSGGSAAVIGPWRRFCGLGHSDDGDAHTFVFVCRRRPESFSWSVPAYDVDLLDGVGARGSAARKSDDTFETLLLMMIEDP